jgi:group II intron reverse transcriptase/maturase
MTSMHATNKPFNIDKRWVYEAYKAVKSNRGSAGVDEQTIEQFDADLSGNLYKIWNRMSSGTYFPPPVRAVAIPKKSGGERILGVPTVADRVAQTVVKMVIEPILDPIFLADSYGYRPKKSALDAVGATRERCWKYDWVLEFDIKGLFDNIDHEFLLRAVRKHITGKWVLLYIERWLKAPMVQEDGTMIERSRGTPQGGVVTPRTQKITSNLTARSSWSVGHGTANDTSSNLDICRIWLYLYVICLAPVPLRGHNASIAHAPCCSVAVHSPQQFSSLPKCAPFPLARPIAISGRPSA